MKALDADAYEPFNEIHYRFSGSEDSVITDHFEIDSTTGQLTVLKTLNDLNEEIQVKIWKLIKVVVTFYLRLRNEFQPFPAKNQASDWLTQWLNQLEVWFMA